MRNTGVNVTFIWIPEHSNIEGNDKENKETKKTTRLINTPLLQITTYVNINLTLKTWLKSNSEQKNTMHELINPLKWNRKEEINSKQVKNGQRRINMVSLIIKFPLYVNLTEISKRSNIYWQNVTTSTRKNWINSKHLGSETKSRR